MFFSDVLFPSTRSPQGCVLSPLCTLMSAKVLLMGVTLLNLQMTHSLCLASIMWIQNCSSAIASVFICPSGRYTSINIFAALLVTSWPYSDVLTSVCWCQPRFYEDVFLFVEFSLIYIYRFWVTFPPKNKKTTVSVKVCGENCKSDNEWAQKHMYGMDLIKSLVHLGRSKPPSC